MEGGYEAKALGHSIFTEADSYEELKESIKDAVQCHFEDENVLSFMSDKSGTLHEHLSKNTSKPPLPGKKDHCQ